MSMSYRNDLFKPDLLLRYLFMNVSLFSSFHLCLFSNFPSSFRIISIQLVPVDKMGHVLTLVTNSIPISFEPDPLSDKHGDSSIIDDFRTEHI